MNDTEDNRLPLNFAFAVPGVSTTIPAWMSDRYVLSRELVEEYQDARRRIFAGEKLIRKAPQ